jgi:hypothetical protein
VNLVRERAQVVRPLGCGLRLRPAVSLSLRPSVTSGLVLNRATSTFSEAKVTATVKVVEPEPTLPATSSADALKVWLPSENVYAGAETSAQVSDARPEPGLGSGAPHWIETVWSNGVAARIPRVAHRTIPPLVPWATPLTIRARYRVT